jgi:hypothetical protein
MVLTIHILSDRTLPISRPSARAAPLLPRSGFVQYAATGDTLDILGAIARRFRAGDHRQRRSTDGGAVTFAEATSTLKLDNSLAFTGKVAGLVLGTT